MGETTSHVVWSLFLRSFHDRPSYRAHHDDAPSNLLAKYMLLVIRIDRKVPLTPTFSIRFHSSRPQVLARLPPAILAVMTLHLPCWGLSLSARKRGHPLLSMKHQNHSHESLIGEKLYAENPLLTQQHPEWEPSDMSIMASWTQESVEAAKLRDSRSHKA